MDMYPGCIRCYTTSMTEYNTFALSIVDEHGLPLAFGVGISIDVEVGLCPLDDAMTIADWVLEGAAPFMYAETATLLDNQVVQVTAVLDEELWQEALEDFVQD